MNLGPTAPPPTRGAASDAILARARRAAAGCGVTRLADITRLDRIGLPVWQAVRPAGRALSVHQGKGAHSSAAQVGALCEAIESHCAELAPADGPCCPIAALPGGADIPALDDVAADRAMPPPRDAEIQWCTACNIATGAPAFLPHELVSLDFTRNYESLFDRSSGGLGANATTAAATAKAILELLENDAVGRWQRQGMLARMDALLDPESIPIAWFRAWLKHLDRLDMQLRLCALRAVTGHPVLLCLLICHDRETGAAVFAGSVCHGDPELALFGALAEAIQSRLTFIAGVRDDMLPSLYRSERSAAALIGAVPPAPPGFPVQDWQSLAGRSAALPDLVADLQRAGFDRILCKTLSPRWCEIAVVKAFIPGLASRSRTARDEALPCA